MQRTVEECSMAHNAHSPHIFSSARIGHMLWIGACFTVFRTFRHLHLVLESIVFVVVVVCFCLLLLTFLTYRSVYLRKWEFPIIQSLWGNCLFTNTLPTKDIPKDSTFYCITCLWHFTNGIPSDKNTLVNVVFYLVNSYVLRSTTNATSSILEPSFSCSNQI